MSYSNEKRKHYYNQLHSLILGSHSRNVYHNNAEIFASHPINEISGLKEINKLWEALMISFPDIERRDSIFVSGINYPDDRAKKNIEGIELVASICHYQGTFENSLFGIPASKKVVYLRYKNSGALYNAFTAGDVDVQFTSQSRSFKVVKNNQGKCIAKYQNQNAYT